MQASRLRHTRIALPYCVLMGNFFYNLGRMVGPKLRQANWVVSSLAGSQEQAIRAEYAVGSDLAQAFLRQTERDGSPQVQQRVAEVGGRLAGCVKERGRQFTFSAARSHEINAVALPGGFIFVMRPLLELCQFERDELAFILGHEMAHVIKRHAIDRLLASSLIRGGISRVPVGGALAAPVIQLAASLLSQGYSRDSELEADQLGIRLMRAAGYEVAAAPRLLNRLRTVPAEAWSLNSYLSSHPPIDVRIRHIERVA